MIGGGLGGVLREGGQELVGVDRLGQVAFGAELGRLDGGGDAPVTGEDEDAGGRVVLAHLPQELEAAPAGHAEVEHRHLRRPGIAEEMAAFTTRAVDIRQKDGNYPVRRLLEKRRSKPHHQGGRKQHQIAGDIGTQDGGVVIGKNTDARRLYPAAETTDARPDIHIPQGENRDGIVPLPQTVGQVGQKVIKAGITLIGIAVQDDDIHGFHLASVCKSAACALQLIILF